MKKFAVILIIAFVTLFVASSCNKKACPAYARAGVEQTGHNI